MAMQDTLHALADPTRREILNLLKQSRMSAEKYCDEREGKFIYYELNTTVLEEIMLWMSELKGE